MAWLDSQQSYRRGFCRMFSGRRRRPVRISENRSAFERVRLRSRSRVVDVYAVFCSGPCGCIASDFSEVAAALDGLQRVERETTTSRTSCSHSRV